MTKEKNWEDSERCSEEMMSLRNSGYISEEIGEEYRGWGERDIIFITAPTGSGKSYFMLHNFLKQVIKRGWRMLYLVNRRILKEQLKKELEEVEDEICEEFEEMGFSEISIENYITILTYQNIENRLQGKECDEEIIFIKKFTCVVYDECHYFYTDANFNTSTELSYLFLRKIFDNKLQIYISATPDKIKKEVESYLEKEKETLESSERRPSVFNRTAREIQEYKIKGSYDYVQMMVFEKIEDLTEIIKENVNEKEEKWLIFVDNIDRGKEFQNGLMNDKKESGEDKYKISKEDIIFLDTHYRKKESTKESAKEIVEKKFSSKKIVISTAVLDNGVSFHDLELRNMVILADTEETFVQMLGRKRRDGSKVKLYICKQGVEHFKKREKHVEEVLRCYKQYKNNLTSISKVICSKVDVYEENLMKHFIVYPNKENEDYKQYLIDQQSVLKELLKDSVSSGYIKEFCYSWNGLLFLNQFSVIRCRKLKLFYNNIIKKLENNEFAFVEQQVEWLGMSKEELEQIIYDSQKSIKEKNCEILEQAIKKVLDKPMSPEKNIEWKLSIKDVLIYFLRMDSEFTNNETGQIGQNDRPLSAKKFKRCVEKAGLPYIMDVEKKSKENKETLYTILKENTNQEEK